MSIFDEEITIEKLKELGFRYPSATQDENSTKFNYLYKTIESKYSHNPKSSIFYFIDKAEENVVTIFTGRYSRLFYDTVKDIIELTTLIYLAEEMSRECINDYFSSIRGNERRSLI